MTLSVCLIVKNEQEVIGRCLNCALKFADEIVVVDTGSSDGTVAEVKKFTKNVWFFKWCDDFSAARNFAFEKATCDLVMWLDADDVVSEENCEKICDLKKCFFDYDMAFLKYAAATEDDAPALEYYRERIFRRDKGYRFEGEVHEAVTPSGKLLYSDAVILHKKVKENEPMRNLRIFQKLISSGKALSERQKFYYGRELLFNGMFRESIAVLEDYLQGDGWAVNKVEACLNLGQAYAEIGESGRSAVAVLRSLLYAPPNSQACCILGEKFLSENNYEAAVYWYKCALNTHTDEKNGAFFNRDFCGFIPLMQLCVLYDRLGDRQKACEYNEAAGRIKPKNVNYLSNKKYFEKFGIRGKQND